jgi:hypothetical protein
MPATHNNAGIAASCFIIVKRDSKITSYQSALDFLKTETEKDTFRAGEEVVVGKNSTNLKLRVVLVHDGKPVYLGIVLYDTVILTFRQDETFTVNSGGHITPTTVTRLNQFSPKWARFHRVDRNLMVGSCYADQDTNRFLVDGPGIVGEEVPPPVLKRHRSKKPHGTLRWLSDGDGNIYSTNNMHPDELVYPELQFDRIGRDGNYNAPLEYELKRESDRSKSWLRGLFGIAKSDVPLPLVNLHRKMWEMPEIELVA